MSPAPHEYQGGGSVQDGIDGNYDFDIGAVISQAWEMTNGTKGTIWLAILFYLLASIPVSFAVEFGLRMIGMTNDPTTGMLAKSLFVVTSQLIQLFVGVPLMTGMFVIGIKLAADAPTESSEVFAQFPKVLKLVGTALLSYLIIGIGFCLLVLPGIYLSVSYAFALPLVAEKGLAPWEALEASRKTVTHHWFKLFFLYIVIAIIGAVSAIPVGLGLIWTVPMSFLVGGLMYLKMFGLNKASAAE
ncbi:MAG: hypothetical protein V4582_00210 [Pseudomonadota bacterium]